VWPGFLFIQLKLCVVKQNLIARPYDHISIGRAGEFMAAYKLQMNGLEVAHINGTCDLHATLPSKRVLRVEVKTSSTISQYGSYRFHRGGSDADIFVLVALKQGLLRVMRSDEMGGKITITLRPADFTQQAEDEDIADLFLH
tara:strand:- start:175 stop:600 length:426 start_codon:yes stop_codon:yes gene_type:complete